MNPTARMCGVAVLLVLALAACVPPGGPADGASWHRSVTDTAPLPTVGAASAAQPESASSTGEWAQLGGNPQRTGFVAGAVPLPWRVAWIWNGPPSGGDGGPTADHLRLPKGVQPVSGGGRLYVGHDDGTVIAIDRASGAEVWRQNAGGPVVNAGAYDEQTDSLYVGTTDGRLVRLRGSDGSQLAAASLGGEVRAAPLLVGQSVFACSTTGTLHSLNGQTLEPEWAYSAGAPLIGSPAYSANHDGLVIVLAEDKTVHAVHAANDAGTRRWRVTVNADQDTRRGDTAFADTYPVVSDASDVVIVRSYLDWNKTWYHPEGAPATVGEIRSFLAANPTYQSLFVLELDTGAARFVAPVMLGAIGNGGDYESVPPQAVVRELDDGSAVAYVQWRSRQACPLDGCDGRSDSTFGEMDLTAGDIRFVQSHKNEGTIRLPTDEQSPLAMAGDALFLAHWMTLGAVRITDRSTGLGDTYTNPIETQELTPTLNTLSAGSCPGRDPAAHSCPVDMSPPGDPYRNDPGFYVYYADRRIYDAYWTTPVRSVIIVDGTIYWKTVDGAIVAIQSGAAPGDGEETPMPPSQPSPSPRPQQETVFLPLVRRR